MTAPLTGRRALVCGASQGIGKACAGAIARAGAEVTVVARDEAALTQVVSDLDATAGQTHRLLVADFTDPPAVADAVKREIGKHGTFQVLLNNTGGPPSGPLMDATTEDLIAGLSKHVLAYQLLVKAVVPGMKDSHYGRIINIISTSVLLPIRGLGVSNTTRGAVANWGRTLAGELGPFGITVNNVLPGFTATDRLTSLLTKKVDKLGKSLQQIEDEAKATIPMGRFATADELGAVVAFLASPAASYVSGVNLPVDGGRTAVQ